MTSYTSPSFQRLLTDELVILNPTSGQDAYGNEEFGYPDPSTVTPTKGRLEQTGSSENVNDRDTQIGQWLLYLLPSNTITGDSRVVRLSDGAVLDVVGPPNPLTRPRTGVHHLEVRLVLFSDGLAGPATISAGSITDNGNGTFTINDPALVSNGNETFTVTSTRLTDNGDGTFTYQ